MNNPLDFDHLPYVASAYALFIAITLWLAIGAQSRLTEISKKLRAADPRARRETNS